MKKRLLNLPEVKLREIARNFSIIGGSKEEVATKLTNYLRTYNLNWADLSCRFQLESTHNLTPHPVLTYESLGHIVRAQLLPEAFSGGDVAVWQGSIERHIQQLADKAEEAGNIAYKNLLTKFLGTWEENKITGSLNVETLKNLKVAAEWAAAYPWDLSNYFSVLRDRLRKLIATVGEELPMVPNVTKEPGRAPKPSKRFNPASGTVNDFGPEEGHEELEKPPEEAVGNTQKTAAAMINKAVGLTARK